MAHRFINQLRENDTVQEVYLIRDKLLRTNKNGNLYLQLLLCDRSGSLDARFWNVSEEKFAELVEGGFYRIEGNIQNFQGGMQLIIRSMVSVDRTEVDESCFPSANVVDTDAMFRRVKEMLRTIKSPDLMNLVDCYLTDADFVEAFCTSPAGVKLHHSYRGGLLEHTAKMMEVVLHLVPLYSELLNQDLLLVGAFLHDSGKIFEIPPQQPFTYSDQGQLLGHSFLALELLQKKVAEAALLAGTAFDEQLAMLLKHLIISHHGTIENGCVKLPMTLEALVLHFVDSLDSKLAEFHKHVLDDPNSGSNWTNYIPLLERKIYKGK